MWCDGVDLAAAMPPLEIWLIFGVKFEELAASQFVPASLPPSADSWSLGDLARWRSTG